jgi:hypothetical protein
MPECGIQFFTGGAGEQAYMQVTAIGL